MNTTRYEENFMYGIECMVWYGMVWFGWHSIWYGMVRHGILGIPYGTVRYGIVGMAWYVSVWSYEKVYLWLGQILSQYLAKSQYLARLWHGTDKSLPGIDGVTARHSMCPTFCIDML